MRPAWAWRGLGAALLLAGSAAAQDWTPSYKYFYEDVFAPFFTLDAASGQYRPARTGASSRSFAAHKPAGTFRVFVVGGSIAGLYGEKELSAALSRLMPGRAVEVIGCGMSGYDSPRERLVIEEVLGYSPDMLVLMSGHNESLAFPWVPRWKLKAAQWGRRLGAVPRPAEPPPLGAVRQRALNDGLRRFDENVGAMARESAARGVPLIVLLPPLNARDEPPRMNLPREAWFRMGWARYLAGDREAARAHWARGAASASPNDAAAAAFFSGRSYELDGRRAEAVAQYEKALAAEEPLLGRCGPGCRAALIRAADSAGAPVADADAEFRVYAAPELPGFDEFTDGVHWRPEMGPLVTRAIVAAARRTSVGKLLSDAQTPPPPKPAPARREEDWTGLLRWAAAEAHAHAVDGLSQVAVAALDYAARRRTGPLDSAQELARLEADSNALGFGWGMPPLVVPRAEYEWALADAQLALGRVAPAGAAFEAAVRAGARDAAFSADLAEYFRRAGDPRRADRELAASRRTAALAARLARPHQSAADVRRRAQNLESAAAKDPSARETAARLYEELGDAVAARRVRCLEPLVGAAQGARCARARLDAGDRDAAAAAARAALAAPGGDAGARRAAALVLQDAGFGAEALELFAAAAKAVPSDATAALDYGVALFGAGRRDEAIAALRKAAALETTPGDAALSLAAALDAAGRGTEAERVLREAQSRAQGKASARFAAALKERSR